MSIAEKLVTIAENQEKVYTSGKIATLDESKYMHPTVSGSVISVNDVNGVEHKLGVKVSSKNLLPFPYNQGTVTQNGGTAIVNNDGTIIFSGTPTAYMGIVLYRGTALVTNGIYTLSVGKETKNVSTTIFLYDNDGNTVFQNGFTSSITINFDEYPTVTSWNITMARSNSNQEMSGTAYPQLEKGTVATPYTPYIADVSGVEVSRYGKNLLDISKPNISYINTSALGYPLTIIEEEIYSGGRDGYSEGGSIHISNPRVPISISFDVSGDFENPINRCSVRHFDNLDEQNIQINSARIMAYPMTTKHIKIENIRTDKNFISVAWFGAKEKSLVISNLQIECGTTATDYEPYQEQNATATADGTVNGLTSVSPNMMLVPDTEGVIINCEYYRDIDAYIDKLMMNVALTGGE